MGGDSGGGRAPAEPACRPPRATALRRGRARAETAGGGASHPAPLALDRRKRLFCPGTVEWPDFRGHCPAATAAPSIPRPPHAMDRRRTERTPREPVGRIDAIEALRDDGHRQSV
jgi:hypothetical protein